jgi:hypothetical protein
MSGPVRGIPLISALVAVPELPLLLSAEGKKKFKLLPGAFSKFGFWFQIQLKYDEPV